MLRDTMFKDGATLDRQLSLFDDFKFDTFATAGTASSTSLYFT